MQMAILLHVYKEIKMIKQRTVKQIFGYTLF